MLPLIAALSGNRPISAIAVTDLPQPDSPIRPSVSPGASEKLTPRTASTRPRPVRSLTRKSSTSSKGVVGIAVAISAPVPDADHRGHEIRHQECPIPALGWQSRYPDRPRDAATGTAD